MAGMNLIKSLIRSSLNARMQRYINKNEITLIEGLTEPSEGNYDTEMSIIMLWGVMGMITLKVHFNVEKAMILAALVQNVPVSEISPKVARSVMSELSNIHAGNIKGFLGKCSIGTSMSLPFLADGNDESIFRKIRDPRAQMDLCRVIIGGVELSFSSEICLLNQNAIVEQAADIEKEIASNFLVQDLSVTGDVRFL
jgi:CheY-specific phosphatase CheX